MSYQHFSAEERERLYSLRSSSDFPWVEIAKLMNRSPATLSRELRRNTDAHGRYLPDTAHLKMQQRRKTAKTPFKKVSKECLEEIKQRMKKFHSPAQIVGRLKLENKESVSHETIYQMIYTNFNNMGELIKYLRHKRKKRKCRALIKSRRGVIQNRVGIEERPSIADKKTEIGHWESDTVIGKNHQGVIVTHVDKAARYLGVRYWTPVAELAPDKTADSINRVTLKAFEEVPKEYRKTVTSDNGKEFVGQVGLAALFQVCWYFARPYHSWERGLNEHRNGLLRQFFPKGTNFKIVKPEKLKKVVDLINHRPRKCLDYKTPHEIFFKQLDAVALQI